QHISLIGPKRMAPGRGRPGGGSRSPRSGEAVGGGGGRVGGAGARAPAEPGLYRLERRLAARVRPRPASSPYLLAAQSLAIREARGTAGALRGGGGPGRPPLPP